MIDENVFPKAYEPQKYEDSIYRRWLTSGKFSPPPIADPLRGTDAGQVHSVKERPRFSIVLPPPNVTGSLHMGHAVMLAIEDLIVRYHRMKGEDTLWLPGLDHAAIATQNVLEKKLKKEEGKSRHDLGREEFLRRVDAFVITSKERIENQVRKMGASCDWSREAYTLDESRSRAVSEMFVRMYRDGLVYRGNRIVNWCPRCASTLADDEVEYKEQKTKFYYFKYGPVVIGTARPETKFLDKTIVVHPDDPRYKDLHGKDIEVEWIGGKIRANIIADPVANPEFGTGAMTITPAHSFEDFELAQKYQLPVTQIINERGELTEHAGEFAGQNARKAREAIVEKLRGLGLLDHIDENYVHNLSVCYRCETPIEPMPKLQWFIAVNKPVASRGNKTLKQLAIEAVESGAITIIPDRFAKEYFHWMHNLRDWCISRQIWFGHRVPVWYHDTCQAVDKNGQSLYGIPAIVGNIQKDKDGLIWCEVCRNGYDSYQHFSPDPDVLDTWFSSGMWTFSTLDTPGDLERFHPTDVIETGYDILFFWVARMILMTTYALGEVPFKTVYLHGLVRDMQGRKMSKSLGNVIDPLDMIEKYGADATRIALFIGTSPGNDLKLNEQKIAGYRNFANKIWNIARFVLSQEGSTADTVNPDELTFVDQWILGRTRTVIADVTQAIERYEFSRAFEQAYDFAWHEFADWYVEAAKVIATPTSRRILRDVLSVILRLLHPAMPFVTETLWEKSSADGLLMTAAWPNISELPVVDAGNVDTQFVELQRVILAVRNAKGQGDTVLAEVFASEKQKPWYNNKLSRAIAARLARVDIK